MLGSIFLLNGQKSQQYDHLKKTTAVGRASSHALFLQKPLPSPLHSAVI